MSYSRFIWSDVLGYLANHELLQMSRIVFNLTECVGVIIIGQTLAFCGESGFRWVCKYALRMNDRLESFSRPAL